MALGAWQWVPSTADAWYRSAWVADMGEFIGDWPLLPPGVIDDADYGETDFLVTLPNATDPDDMSIVADGSYATPVWVSYRYSNVPYGPPDSYFYYYGDPSYATGGVLPSTPPSGAHIYVIVYGDSINSGTPPVNSPAYYVPPEYAALGAAAFKTAMGHWSDEQSAFDVDRLLRPRSIENPSISPILDFSYFDGPSYEGPYVTNTDTAAAVAGADEDLAARLQLLLDDLLAMTPSNFGFLDPSIFVQADKWVFPNFGLPLTSTAHVYAGIQAGVAAEFYDVTMYATPPRPDAIDDLVYEIDYSESPYIAPDGSTDYGYVYDPDPTTWDIGTLHAIASKTYSETHYGELGEADCEAEFIMEPHHIGWIDGTSEVGPTPAYPLPVSDGVDIDVPGPLPTDDPRGYIDIEIDPLPITTGKFWIVTQPTALVTGTLSCNQDFVFQTDKSHKGYVEGVYVSGVDGGVDTVYHYPAWRYWVPGEIVPSSAPPTTQFAGWGIPI